MRHVPERHAPQRGAKTLPAQGFYPQMCEITSMSRVDTVEAPNVRLIQVIVNELFTATCHECDCNLDVGAVADRWRRFLCGGFLERSPGK